MKVTFSMQSVIKRTSSSAAVRSEKLVAEAGDISGTQRKGNVLRWKPLPGNGS
jgi:hypothetical protein